MRFSVLEILVEIAFSRRFERQPESRIRSFLKRQKWTQERFAQAVGVDRRSVTRWLSQGHGPGWLTHVLRALTINPLADEGEMIGKMAIVIDSGDLALVDPCRRAAVDELESDLDNGVMCAGSADAALIRTTSGGGLASITVIAGKYSGRPERVIIDLP